MPTVPRAAVSVIVVREEPRGGSGAEVLLVRRAPHLRAFPDLWAFPGGTLEPGDSGVPVDGAGSPEEGARLAAAVREVFEETGICLFRRKAPVPPASLGEIRAEFVAGGSSGAEGFAGVLGRLGGEIHAGDFTPAANLVTGAAFRRRFDTRFYRAALPPGEEARILPGEIVESAWLAPESALERWRGGGFPLAPPTIGLLERWSADSGEYRRRNREAESRERIPVRYTPGVWVLPCRTPTLPPATHTNAILVGGEHPYLVDPAPEAPEEREALFRQVDGLLRQGPGSRLRGVLVTHHHRDHIGSVAAAAVRYGVPVGAHPETLSRIGGQLSGADGAALERRPLLGGEVLPLGTAPDGTPGWTLEVRFAPGHAPGHLAFVESRYGAMLLGDLVASGSSILISPEDGDLALYLESLRALAGECRGAAYPAHGVPVVAGRALLERQIRHREARERQLLEALGREPAGLEELGRAVYPESEVPASGPVRELALVSLRSGLAKLEAEGRASRTGGRWAAA